ncbi:MAG: hypothetical protein AB7F89_09885 [Pirellulaceae bacterium]
MSTAVESKICPDCQATCAPDAPRCWMCQADLAQVDTIVTAELVAPPRGGVSETVFAGATLLLVGLAALLGIGIAIDEPGAAVVYALVAAPALLATVIRVQIRKSKVGHVSWAERFVTLLVSASVVVAILVMLVVASVVALFIYCLIDPPSFH